MKEPTSQHSEKDLRNDIESGCGSPYLKTRNHQKALRKRKKQQATIMAFEVIIGHNVRTDRAVESQ